MFLDNAFTVSILVSNDIIYDKIPKLVRKLQDSNESRIFRTNSAVPYVFFIYTRRHFKHIRYKFEYYFY